MAGALEITRERRANELELKVSGRLDGYWANHLADAIRDVLREGVHHLRLNLSQTSYLSSAGIRVLVEAYKEFAGVDGTFVVVHPSPGVKQVLDLAGMGPLLCAQGGPAAAAAAPESQAEHREVDGCIFETYAYEASATLACRASGHPEKLSSAAFAESECEVLALPKDVFALGVGAFGDGFSACRDRFGEFLAVAGNAACQPTDNSNYPDYLVTSGSLIPKVVALYGVACRGGFQKLMRFESSSSGAPVGFGAVLAQVRRQYPNRGIGMVLVAESAGLLGACLKQPPVAEGGEPARVFQHPEVRKWISFSPERAFSRSVAVIAGVFSDSPPPDIKPLLRPMTADGAILGHFHAAAFGYHPLQKGRIDLHSAVSKLFDTAGLQGVVHLLSDDRPASGAGESEFLRGACWFGPIDRFVSAGEAL
jgi:anti-anti-sigma factor